MEDQIDLLTNAIIWVRGLDTAHAKTFIDTYKTEIENALSGMLTTITEKGIHTIQTSVVINKETNDVSILCSGEAKSHNFPNISFRLSSTKGDRIILALKENSKKNEKNENHIETLTEGKIAEGQTDRFKKLIKTTFETFTKYATSIPNAF